MKENELKKVSGINTKNLNTKTTAYIDKDDYIVFKISEEYVCPFHEIKREWNNLQVTEDMFNKALSTYKIVEEPSQAQKNVGRVIQMIDDGTRYIILFADDEKKLYRCYNDFFVLYSTEDKTWEFVQ